MKIKTKFKVGDRVMAIDDVALYHTKGKIGIIKSIQERFKDSNNIDYSVDFDDEIVSVMPDKHLAYNCFGTCRSGHGIFCWAEDLKKVKK